jgi:hypothetical protein
MKKATINLFDMVYGEIVPIESTLFGRVVFLFYPVDGDTPTIIYYPNTKEIKTLRELETDFSSFIPLGRDKFKESYQMWLTERYGDEFTMKGIDYLEFVSKETFDHLRLS